MSKSFTFSVASSPVSIDTFAVVTVVGLRDTRMVSHSSSVNNFLLITCMEAPEFNDKLCLSHGQRFDGDGTHYSNVGEKIVATFSKDHVPRILVNS